MNRFLFNCYPKLCDFLLNASLANPHQFKHLNIQLSDVNNWKDHNFGVLSSNIIMKRLFIGIIIAVVTKLLVKYLSEKILLLLLNYNYITANPIQYKDCFNRNVTINKYYCIEIPSRFEYYIYIMCVIYIYYIYIYLLIIYMYIIYI